MPTYQYACTQCGHGFEAVQSFTDSALTECPECEGRLRKVFSSVGIVFKGSGFYRTDSRGTEGKSGKDGKDAEKSDGAKEKVAAAKESSGSTEKKKDSSTSTASAGSGPGGSSSSTTSSSKSAGSAA